MSLVFPYQRGFAWLTPVVGTTVEILRFAQDDTKKRGGGEFGIWTLTQRIEDDALASPVSERLFGGSRLSTNDAFSRGRRRILVR